MKKLFLIPIVFLFVLSCTREKKEKTFNPTYNPDKNLSNGLIPCYSINRALWSDGKSMWIGFGGFNLIDVYDISTKKRNTLKSNNLIGKGAISPNGLWSDGTTMWVPNNSREIFAYNLTTKERDTAKDYNLIAQSRGLWSDGTTMWVTAGFNIHAYNIYTKEREEPSKEFYYLKSVGNESPRGIWSDGKIMWVTDSSDGKIYAYDMQTKRPDPSKDFNILKSAGNESPSDIWSNGETMWVTDWDDCIIYAYDY